MASDKILAAKQKHVEELVEALKGSTTYVFVSSRGLTVEQDTVLRSDLRKAGVQFKVIKNTTLKLVSRNSDSAVLRILSRVLRQLHSQTTLSHPQR